MGDIDSRLMLRRLQYFESSQSPSGFAPLLALQEMQHRAMLIADTIVMSLTMCSQEALRPRFAFPFENSTPQ